MINAGYSYGMDIEGGEGVDIIGDITNSNDIQKIFKEDKFDLMVVLTF